MRIDEEEIELHEIVHTYIPEQTELERKYNSLQTVLRGFGFEAGVWMSEGEVRCIYINGIVAPSLSDELKVLTDEDCKNYHVTVEIEGDAFHVSCRPRYSKAKEVIKKASEIRDELILFLSKNDAKNRMLLEPYGKKLKATLPSLKSLLIIFGLGSIATPIFAAWLSTDGILDNILAAIWAFSIAGFIVTAIVGLIMLIVKMKKAT